MARKDGKVKKAEAAHQKAKKTLKPGEGKRFEALTNLLAARGDVTNPEAVAASIGRGKYGKQRFQEMAASGRKKGKKKA